MKDKKLFDLDEDGLIIQFNRELLNEFSNMKAHPDSRMKRWTSNFPHREINGNSIFAEDHFQIDFALGLSTLRIQSQVKYTGKGWYFEIDEYYSLHDGREYNKTMTLNDLVSIFKKCKVRYN